MLNPNTIVGGRYKVVKPLGGGGMKLVYLAEDLRLASRRCALAEMVDSFTNPDMQRQAVAAFQREANMLAQLNNEHIPRVFDSFSEQNRHYLVMEFIDGITLEEAMKAAGGKLGEARVVDIALQILDTLIYLHGLVPPVVYRDLKPSNVMLLSGGQAKLIDFGIARHFQPLRNATMIGTQGYAPPEQYRGKAETRSDLYALGATMHHALSGRDPTAEAPFSFPPLRSAVTNVNAALAGLVDHALSYDVERRISDASEFKRRLMELKAVIGPAASTVAGAQPKWQPQMNPPIAPMPASPAPTILSNPSEIRCPGCNRHVPADSKFCSFCATDLRWVLGPAEVVSGPGADTMLLSEERHSYPNRAGGIHRAHPRRRFVFRIATIAGALFFTAYFGTRFFDSQAPNPGSPDEGMAPPLYPEAPAPEPVPGAEPPHNSPQENALRRSLDGMGYRSVHFRIDGDTVQLWGTVATPWDRTVVQGIASAFTGRLSVDDHLNVLHGDFGDAE